MPTDGLPFSDVAGIDLEIRERLSRVMAGKPNPGDVEAIALLNRRRVELTNPRIFAEASDILARIAAAGIDA